MRDANEEVVAIYEGKWHLVAPATPCASTMAGPPYDRDCDGVRDGNDNCPTAVNPTWQTVPPLFANDQDDDGIGDPCDPTLFQSDPWQENFDGDSIPDMTDAWPFDSTNTGAPPQARWQQPPLMWPLDLHLSEWPIYGSAAQGRIAMARPDTVLPRGAALVADDRTDDSIFTRKLRWKGYELKDHLGNVRVVVSDLKESYNNDGNAPFVADLMGVSNYYGFGMLQPKRSWQRATRGWRWGFNGKEQDSGVSGVGNEYDYGFRVYNPRLARFLSVDPLAPEYPWYTPYQFAGNMPINMIDRDGLEPKPADPNYGKNIIISSGNLREYGGLTDKKYGREGNDNWIGYEARDIFGIQKIVNSRPQESSDNLVLAIHMSVVIQDGNQRGVGLLMCGLSPSYNMHDNRSRAQGLEIGAQAIDSISGSNSI